MGSIKIKSSGSPTSFPPSLHSPISFSSCSTLEPVWRLLNHYDFLVELSIRIPWVIKFGFYTFKKFWFWQKSSIHWSVHPPLPFSRCEMTNLLTWSPKYIQSVLSWYWKTMLWSIDSRQNRVSTGQYNMGSGVQLIEVTCFFKVLRRPVIGF